MTDAIHEQVSAFVDGELSAAESELLLKRVERDAELRARIGRNVLVGEALRATRAQGPSRDFAAKVAAAVERENTPMLERSKVMQWLKPIAGGAIAAGVAAVALVATQVVPRSSTNEPLNQTAAISQSTNSPLAAPSMSLVAGANNSAANNPAANGFGATNSSSMSYIVPQPSVTNRPPPPIQVINSGRLANFVVAHSEYSSPLGRRNVLTGLLAEEPAVDETEVNENATDISQEPKFIERDGVKQEMPSQRERR